MSKLFETNWAKTKAELIKGTFAEGVVPNRSKRPPSIAELRETLGVKQENENTPEDTEKVKGFFESTRFEND